MIRSPIVHCKGDKKGLLVWIPTCVCCYHSHKPIRMETLEFSPWPAPFQALTCLKNQGFPSLLLVRINIIHKQRPHRFLLKARNAYLELIQNSLSESTDDCIWRVTDGHCYYNIGIASDLWLYHHSKKECTKLTPKDSHTDAEHITCINLCYCLVLFFLYCETACDWLSLLTTTISVCTTIAQMCILIIGIHCINMA